jgi:hypothetical protein
LPELWWPEKNETLVLPLSRAQVCNVLDKNIRPLEKGYRRYDPAFLFNGWIKKEKFCISRLIRHPDNFLPLINGHIDATSRGSLLYLRYRLFPSTLYFLIFWSILTVMMAVFFFVVYGLFWYGIVSLSLGAMNYLVTILKFNKEFQRTQLLIRQLFNEPNQYIFRNQ